MMNMFNYSPLKLNNTRFAYILCGIMCLILALPGWAQSMPPWVISPQYHSIQPLSTDLFKVKSNSFFGVIDNNGNVIVPTEADSITNFTNGYALVLKKEEDKFRIHSILDYTRKVVGIAENDGPLYVGTFPFFSERKCVVQNKKGKYGFLDVSGHLVIPCKYLSARPFHEGLASVCKGKGGLKGLFNAVVDMVSGDADNTGPSLYINEAGQALKLSSEIGTPDIATTFNDGKALVMSDKGTFVIDKNGRIVSVEFRNGNLFLDDYFILTSADEPRRVNIPYEIVNIDDDYSVYQEGCYKGLKYNTIVLLPSQFDDINYLGEGIAIVKCNGKVGLIGLSSSILNCDVKINNETLTASATLPSNYDGVSLTLACINGSQRSSYMMAGDKSTRTLEIPFPYNESQTNDADVVFELMGNGVVLWRSSKSLINDTKTNQSTNSRFSQDTEKKNVKDNRSKAKGGISASCPSSIKANAKNICSVPVTVTNRSNVALNVKISSSTGLSTTIVVPAGKSKTVTFSINDVKKGKQCTFTATSSAGSSTCKTTLNPYFAL